MNYFFTMLVFIIGLVVSKLAGRTYEEALLLCCSYLLIGILVTLLNIKDKMK